MKCFLFFDVGIEKKILTGEGSFYVRHKKKKTTIHLSTLTITTSYRKDQ